MVNWYCKIVSFQQIVVWGVVPSLFGKIRKIDITPSLVGKAGRGRREPTGSALGYVGSRFQG